ncbi:MAG: vitamin B12 dependent-methionine synthase activation domain-containing protein [Candidatus Heimdallarchaeota archaeon]
MKILRLEEITLDIEEVVQLLRGRSEQNKPKEEQKKPPEGMLQTIRNLIDNSMNEIQPIAIYDIFSSKGLNPKHIFQPSETTILSVCTIGPNLENKSKEELKNDNLMNGIILDAIASHAAEVTAEETNKIILEKEKELIINKKYTSRFSPGYCQWLIDLGQKLIFDSLHTDQIQVKLTPSYMMVPRKSISFAINIGSKVDQTLGLKECKTCKMENCDYRQR